MILMKKNWFHKARSLNNISFLIYVPSIYSRIIKDELKTLFPNIEILLQIFLSLFITNVPNERSFSKLKFIKNALRNSLSDEILLLWCQLKMKFWIHWTWTKSLMNLCCWRYDQALFKNEKKNRISIQIYLL